MEKRVDRLFYLQDGRGYVGNAVKWWRESGGYTTELDKARVFTRTEAQAQHDCRDTDIPWPKDYIDERAMPFVDMQFISRKKALEGTGIDLRKPPKLYKMVINCCECGRFMSERQALDPCPNCGADNRP